MSLVSYRRDSVTGTIQKYYFVTTVIQEWYCHWYNAGVRFCHWYRTGVWLCHWYHTGVWFCHWYHRGVRLCHWYRTGVWLCHWYRTGVWSCHFIIQKRDSVADIIEECNSVTEFFIYHPKWSWRHATLLRLLTTLPNLDHCVLPHYPPLNILVQLSLFSTDRVEYFPICFYFALFSMESFLAAFAKLR